MPIVSTLGAASSRGFGEFNQQAGANYIENYFNTYLYTGNGGSQTISNGIALANTAEWSAYKLQQSNSFGGGIAIDSTGNFYVTGRANDGSNYIILAKYNSLGVLQWQRKLKQADSTGYGVATDSNSNVYVIGSATDGNNYLIVAKYNSSGTIQWQRRLREANSIGYGIATDSSGNVYVTGTDFDVNFYIIVAKYDSSGVIQWQRKLKQADSTGYGVATDSSGNVYVIGNAFDGSNYIIIAKYNSSGVIQWQRKLREGASVGSGITTDSNNNVYVTGRANDGSNYWIIAKYNSSGAIQWQRKLRRGTSSVGSGITTDSSDNVYVTGLDFIGSNYFIVAKYNSSGVIQWQRSLQQGGSSGSGIIADSGGNVYSIGTANDGIEYLITAKLKTDGATTSGTAFVTMTEAPATDSAGTATDSAGTATDSAGTATETTAVQSAVSGAGGLVWMKGRSGATDHALYDTARGATFDIASNLTTGQTTQTTGLTSFNANGFSIGSLAKLNTSSAIYAAWTFREKAKFFDVVTYTGNGANRTISHNLGSVPGMIIIKRTDTTAAWAVYHRSLANTEYLVLNTTALKATGATYWNSTTATATEFSLGTSTDVNANGGTYVAYLFAHDAGGFGLTGSDSVISCGSYTTNASGVATVTLGWEPQFVIIKTASGATSEWGMYDNIRGFSLSSTWRLKANAADAENSMGATFYPTSTGFVDNGSTAVNSTFVYMAIRRGPMKIPTDGTTVLQPTVYTGTNVNNRLVNTTIAPDMVWIRQRNDTVLGGMVVADRLRGQPYSLTGTTAAEVTSATAFDQQIVSTEYGTAFSSMNGVWVGTDATAKLNVNTTASNHIAEAFKRAPGFFDVVAYTGTGSNTTISHNLAAVPELILIKRRASTNDWAVYSAGIANTEYLLLNTTAAKTFDTLFWNSTSPTSTVFSLGTTIDVNASANTYIAYLFASCPGVSKVGSYTGTGTTQQINCGFTSGARLVLIKRTDSTGDWYIYDSARGIVAGNDPYLRLNSTGAEVTNTDYVDAYSAGFELSSTAPAGLNEAPGITWVSRTSGFGTTTIYGVTYGNGLYVAVGDSGKLTTSTDGITWTSRTSGFGTNAIYGVTYGNGLFVAVGNSGTLTTSTDGITWTSRTSGFGTTLIASVAYGNGLFVAVGSAGKISTSTDGITWTSRTSGTSANFSGVTYGNGLYVAVGSNGVLLTSPDGITWTSRTSGFGTDAINSVTYGNGLYVAGGSGASGTITTSTDGITWTSRTSGFGAGAVIYGLAYGGGVFVAVGDGMTTSTDGITWTSRTSGFGLSQIRGVGYGNGLFVAVGTSGKMTISSPNYIYLAIA